MDETSDPRTLNPRPAGGSAEAFAAWIPSPKERNDMIDVAAYHIAQRSGFKSDPRDCWVAAEAQIDLMLSLKESQAKLQTIVDSALDAVVMIDSGGIITEWNTQAEKIFGWAKNEALGQMIETTIIPPRYRAAHRQGMSRYLASGEGPILNRLIEIQAINREGHEFHIELTISRASTKGKIEFCAFIRDITERKRNESVQAARIRLMEYASNHTLKELLVATLDEAGTLTESPIGFYHFLEADQKTLSLQAWSTRTTSEFCTAAGEGSHYNIDEAGVWVECIRARSPVIHNDYATLPDKKGLPQGHAQVVREMVVPVFRKGLIVAVLGVGNKALPYEKYDLETASLLADLAWDLAESKRLEAELQAMATTDFLTGLFNRRHFIARMDEELARLNRIDTQYASVLMLDLDHFKNINDTYGHAMGDAVLQRFAALIRGELRKIDTGGRVGGEEFAILLPGADTAAARAFAERLRQKVSEMSVSQGGHTATITVSIGIAAMNAADSSADAALIRADKALYQAKLDGRNRVEVARADPENRS